MAEKKDEYTGVGCLILIVLALCYVFWPFGSDDSKSSSQSSSNITAKKADEQKPKKDEYLPELMPVDVYQNLEDKGFKTEKDLGSQYGNFWISKNSINGIDYEVNVESDNATDIKSVRTTVIGINKNESQVRQFLKYVGSVLFLYRDTGQKKFNTWLDNNFNSGGTTMVGKVKVDLNAPSKTTRIMHFKKE